MHHDFHFQQLKTQLKNCLPGNSSHLKMLPPGRLLMVPSGTDNYRESAVLILLFPSLQGVELCLIRRPSTMKNHAGQIAFPGGRREPFDTDLIRTALREANEEIGIDMNKVEIAGVLSPVYVQISGFVITPVVGCLSERPAIRMDSSEVDEVIFITLDDVMSEVSRCNREMETMTGLLEVPGYEIGGNFIWGATAMILTELVDIYYGTNQL